MARPEVIKFKFLSRDRENVMVERVKRDRENVIPPALASCSSCIEAV